MTTHGPVDYPERHLTVRDGDEVFEVADASGIGTHYQLWTHAQLLEDSDALGRFSATVASGGSGLRLIAADVTYADGMNAIRDAVQAELEAERR